VEGNRLRKLLKIHDKLYLIQISAERKKHLQIEFLNKQPDKLAEAYVTEFVKEWFDIHYDIKPFYSVAEKDILLKDLVHKYYGLRLVGIPNFFEAISWAIIGQHINLGLAYSMKRKFVEAFGEALRYENKTYRLFPEAEDIAKLTPDELMLLQFTRKKAEYLIGIANEIVNGGLNIDKLTNMKNFEEVKKRLIKIKGIGNWSANYVLMKYFRFPEAFPIEDVGLHNAIRQRLNLQNKPAVEKIRELAFNWRGYEAYATFYLWRSLVK
jgi:DNA-3-methyladenine glycosylase II